jgi:hypothetical protein
MLHGREPGRRRAWARDVGILEQLFLIRRLEPWFQNRLKRLVTLRDCGSSRTPLGAI